MPMALAPPQTPTNQYLWRIQRLDEKWEELHRRKTVVLQRMERFAAGHYGYQSACACLPACLPVCMCVYVYTTDRPDLSP